ncbi:MAG TPA: PIG-L family deacetylase [Candidatus Aquilonibacter sp.]|nr:PIG-L family deacetylase [Candidatus Aquilonibacter sp.]
MNPYRQFVSAFARLIAAGKSLPLGGITPPRKTKPAADAPVALIFSPHPDDECITGGLALRLMRETEMRIVNTAVTLGSDKKRRPARRRELKNACDWLGFELELTKPGGLEKINPQTRADNLKHWSAAVKIIAASLTKHRPRIIFFPHELDQHRAHIGTHFLVMDALKSQPRTFQTMLVETEFWGQMPSPNLLVESSVEDVADLLAALSFHAGEMRRNPYHLRLPAWLQDNVRRGVELVGGPGSAAPNFTFATLFRLRRWKNGRVKNVCANGKIISAAENPGNIFSPAC